MYLINSILPHFRDVIYILPNIHIFILFHTLIIFVLFFSPTIFTKADSIYLQWKYFWVLVWEIIHLNSYSICTYALHSNKLSDKVINCTRNIREGWEEKAGGIIFTKHFTKIVHHLGKRNGFVNCSIIL